MSDAAPDRCLLDHRAFTALGPVVFRRAETDGTPVMILPLGDREAAVPLRALQRELDIEDDSADGRMLDLIAESLDYVTDLNLGDALPGEVLDGRASWQPGARHLQLAAARLRRRLLVWLAAGDAAGPMDPDTVLRLDSDPANRAQVQAAFDQAARALGLSDPSVLVSRLEALARELSYIEALRYRLLNPVQALVSRLAGLHAGRQADQRRLETLTQVERLSIIGLRQIAERFREVDAQTGEVLPALRNADSQCGFIRSNRDWLYRGSRAWGPIPAEWDQAGPDLDDALWGLLGRTYHFLAPRYMKVTEWQTIHGLRRARDDRQRPAVMTW